MPVTIAKRAKRGRPADPNLRDRILEAAREEFLRNGPEGGSISRIAKLAGCSRVTIYEQFQSREELYIASVTSSSLASFRLHVGPVVTSAPRETLLRLARSYASTLLMRAQTENIYLVWQASEEHPDLPAAFYEQGPRQILSDIAAILSQLDAAGALAIPELDVAAEQFLALIRGNSHVRLMLGLQPDEEGMRDSYLETSVDLFLRGYAPTRAK